MLVIRGTSSLKEVLTDLAGHLVDFALGGHTHNGMLQVVQQLGSFMHPLCSLRCS